MTLRRRLRPYKELSLSTIPSDSGCRAIVLVSENMAKQRTNSRTRTSATVVASWFDRGCAS